MREEAFLARLARGSTRPPPEGLGDDAALLPGGLVVGADACVEGLHFAHGTPLVQVARKAVGACISDICAMGAEPTAVLICVEIPSGTDAEALADALLEAARHHGVQLVGGDTVAAPHGALALAVTALGTAHPAGVWTRAGGRPGDRLVVSGPLGGSLAHGRHLEARPRTDVVRELHLQGVPVTAAMDLSDGLALDLPRLCRASGLGARIDGEAVPVHAHVDPGRDGLLAALGDGEDFELLLALAPEAEPPGNLITIGALEAGQGPRLLRGGLEQPWPRGGYEHVF